MSITISGGGIPIRKISSYVRKVDVFTPVKNMVTYRYGCGVAIYGSNVYIFGGVSERGVSNRLEIFNMSTHDIVVASSMLYPRAFFATGLYNGKIYVVGGVDAEYFPTDTILVYDISNNTWSSISTTLPKPVAFAGFAQIDRYLYITGGMDSDGNILNTTYVLDMATNTVSTKRSMNTARENHACAVLQDKIYCFGGDNRTYNLRSIEVYDPSTDTWTVSSVEMPEALTGISASTITIGDRSYIIVMGG